MATGGTSDDQNRRYEEHLHENDLHLKVYDKGPVSNADEAKRTATKLRKMLIELISLGIDNPTEFIENHKKLQVEIKRLNSVITKKEHKISFLMSENGKLRKKLHLQEKKINNSKIGTGELWRKRQAQIFGNKF